MLCDNQGRCGHSSLGVGGVQFVGRAGSAFERTAEHGLSFLHGCVVQVAAEVGDGVVVVVEGADAPGARAISSRIVQGSSHWPPTLRS